MTVYVDNISMETQLCGGCGITFAWPQEVGDRRREDHEGWYCPNGCCRVFSGKTEEQKLREQLERERRRAQAEAGRASLLEDQRNQVVRAHKRMRERVKNGLCPCCNRTFQNLLEHMRTQHPDFGQHQQLRALRDTYGLTQRAVAAEAGVDANHVSLYERDRPVADYARAKLDTWMEENL